MTVPVQVGGKKIKGALPFPWPSVISGERSRKVSLITKTGCVGTGEGSEKGNKVDIHQKITEIITASGGPLS